MGLVSLLLNILIFLLVVGLILWVVDYAGRIIPGIPAGFLRIIQAIIVVVALIWFLKMVLAPVAGGGAVKLSMTVLPFIA